MFVCCSPRQRTQLTAVLRKTVLVSKRDRRELAREFLAPILLLAVLALISNIGGVQSSPAVDYPSVPIAGLHAAAGAAVVAVVPCNSTSNSNTAAFGTAFAARLASDAGVGVLCFPCERGGAGGEECEGGDLLSFFAGAGRGLLAGVVFDEVTERAGAPPLVSYRLRLDTAAWVSGVSARTFSPGYGPKGAPLPPDSTPRAYNAAFLPLLSAVDGAIASLLAEAAGSAPAFWYAALSTRPFPSLAWTLSVTASIAAAIVPLYMTLIFTLQVRALLTRVLEEKERKLKLTMQQMGLTDAIFWLSWFLTAASKSLLIVTAVVIIACTAGIFPHSDPTLVWCFFALFSASTVGFAFTLTALFANAATGGAVGMIIYLLAAAPSYALTGTYGVSVSPGVKIALALLAPCAFNLGTVVIVLAEGGPAGGVHWSNWTDPDLTAAGVSIASLMGMLALDAVLYMAAAVWANRVLATEFGGLPAHPLFCLGFRRDAQTEAGKSVELLAAARERRAVGAAPRASASPLPRLRALQTRLRELLAPFARGALATGAGVAPGRAGRGGDFSPVPDMDRGSQPGRRPWTRTVEDAGGLGVAGTAGGEDDAMDEATWEALHGPSLSRAGWPMQGRSRSQTQASIAAQPPAAPVKALLAAAAADVEAVSPDVALRPCLRVTGLTKAFPPSTANSVRADGRPSPPRLALNGFSLDMYAGHVTCLLGHNGAGKTTAVQLLTGLLTASEGDATFGGVSLIMQAPAARALIGVCPQHDVLFPTLTAAEHVALFAGIKGLPAGPETDVACASLLARLGLADSADVLASALSGGQKRRLSVAIALVGDPPLLFLDEPTSGLDPAARRTVWSVVQERKAAGACIILTTHHMDEADILGDRIAIMARGCLRFVGSPLYLKARFGLGYTLALSLTPDQGMPSVEAAAHLLGVVRACVPAASVQSSDAHAGAGVVGEGGRLDLALLLPREGAPAFQRLFQSLDALVAGGAPPPTPSRDGKGQVVSGPVLASYTLTVPSLEDVYLRLAGALEEEEEEEKETEEGEGQLGGELFSTVARSDTDASMDFDFRRGDGHVAHVGAGGGAGRCLPSAKDGAACIPSSPLPRAPAAAGDPSALWWLDARRRAYGHTHAALAAGIAGEDGKGEDKDGDGEVAAVLARPPRGSCVRTVGQVQAHMWRKGLSLRRNPRTAWLSLGTPIVFVAISTIFGVLRSIAAPAVPALLAFSPSFEFAAGLRAAGAPRFFALPAVALGNGTPGSPDTTLEAVLASLSAAFPGQADETGLSHPSPFPAAACAPVNIGEVSSCLLLNTSYAAGAVLASSPSEGGWFLTLMFNSSLTNSPPTLLSALHSALLAASLNASGAFAGGIAAGDAPILSASLDPLPPSPSSGGAAVALGEYLASSLAGLYTAMGFLACPALQAFAVVQERESRAKDLQMLAGATPLGYWTATWLWDAGLHTLPWAVGTAILLAAGPPSYRDHNNGFAVAMLLLLFGWASPGPAYALSFTFTVPANAQMWTRIAFSGMLMAVFALTFALSFPSLDLGPRAALIAAAVKAAGWLFPPFALASGLAAVSTSSAAACPPVRIAAGLSCYPSSPWAWDAAGGPLLCLTLSLPFWAAVLAWLERAPRPTAASCAQPPLMTMPLLPEGSKGGARSPPAHAIRGEDGEVAAERARVDGIAIDLAAPSPFATSHWAGNAAMARAASLGVGIVAHGLRKVYPGGTAGAGAAVLRARSQAGVGGSRVGPRVAVADLSLAVPPGEVLGLLGPNGAGKTSAMSMIVGEASPTSGRGWIVGLDVTGRDRGEALDLLGYCPQADALFPALTARESLLYFAALSCVPSHARPPLVDAALSCMGMTPHANTRVLHLSGGSRRRLSLLIAYIGAPLAVVLDEPSTGIDPVARRRMHSLLRAAAPGRSTVLSTHVMEEAEGCCDRLGIMSAGLLACLASPRRLRAIFGQGYTVEVRLDGGGGAEAVRALVQTALAGLGQPAHEVAVREENGGHVRVEVKNGGGVVGGEGRGGLPSGALAALFGALEGARAGWADGQCTRRVVGYSISAVTLESVFLSLTRAQEKGLP
jgi:ABC-type multidrug transport system ATPase subunit